MYGTGRCLRDRAKKMEIGYEIRFESFEDLFFYICREIERMESGAGIRKE